jgi:hypothetical protein
MSVQVTRWGSHDPRVTTVVGKKDGRRLLSDTATACGSRARRRSIRRVVDTAKKSRKVVHGVSRSRTPSLEAPPIRRRARTGWGCEAPRGRAPGSARRRGGSKVRDECAEPEDSFPRALARPLRRSSRSGGASRRLESADEDNPQEISPGRAATRGDREPCEALDSELSRLHAWTYLVATARARRTVRRPRREATEGLSAALDSEMAAMTGKAVVMPEGAESDWGGRGRQPGTRSSRGASGTRCASLRRGAARDVCAPRRVPNRTNEREERNALSRAVVCSLASPYGGGHLRSDGRRKIFSSLGHATHAFKIGRTLRSKCAGFAFRPGEKKPIARPGSQKIGARTKKKSSRGVHVSNVRWLEELARKASCSPGKKLCRAF